MTGDGAQIAILAYLQVVAINLVLSGDNVVVISMAAAGLPSDLRQKAIIAGIVAAAVIRIVFAAAASRLLAVTGIMLLGGLLLFWVCWNMFNELRSGSAQAEGNISAAMNDAVARPVKTLRHAITQIIVADVSMSLDNVLAVAGAAKENMSALVFGLVLSVLLMALASTLVAKLLARFRWIAWFGLAIIMYVAAKMVFDGAGIALKCGSYFSIL